MERWLFYRHVGVNQFPNQHMCETALTRRLVIIGTIAANAPYIGPVEDDPRHHDNLSYDGNVRHHGSTS